ncbi:MAG: hypothetical protein OES12_09430 [Anaerolineae bacterium]|nr:hypothetical protein [Anaerolineae bacterium]
MRSKLLIFTVLATVSIVVLIAAATVTAFALVEGDSAQAEEVLINETLDVAPAEVEAVSRPQVVKPVPNYDRASYAGHEGGCRYSSAKMQLTEVPSEPKVDNSLLTLAE